MPASIIISPKKLQGMIRSTVRDELRAVFGDVDFGLELRDSILKRLNKSQRSKKAGRIFTAGEIIKRLKLKI